MIRKRKTINENAKLSWKDRKEGTVGLVFDTTKSESHCNSRSSEFEPEVRVLVVKVTRLEIEVKKKERPTQKLSGVLLKT